MRRMGMNASFGSVTDGYAVVRLPQAFQPPMKFSTVTMPCPFRYAAFDVSRKISFSEPSAPETAPSHCKL